MPIESSLSTTPAGTSSIGRAQAPAARGIGGRQCATAPAHGAAVQRYLLTYQGAAPTPRLTDQDAAPLLLTYGAHVGEAAAPGCAAAAAQAATHQPHLWDHGRALLNMNMALRDAVAVPALLEQVQSGGESAERQSLLGGSVTACYDREYNVIRAYVQGDMDVVNIHVSNDGTMISHIWGIQELSQVKLALLRDAGVLTQGLMDHAAVAIDTLPRRELRWTVDALSHFVDMRRAADARDNDLATQRFDALRALTAAIDRNPLKGGIPPIPDLA